MTADDSPSRRRRRSRDDVQARITTAAGQLFAERGFAATTTREIALQADVSETLLFRYYGDKAGLFNAVVTEPFNRAIASVADGDGGSMGASGTAVHPLYHTIYNLLEDHRDLLRAVFWGQQTGTGEVPPLTDGLEPFFAQAQNQLIQRYAATSPGFDWATGVRLGFGMMAAAVMMREWLFPGQSPSRDHIADVLGRMIEKAMAPQPND